MLASDVLAPGIPDGLRRRPAERLGACFRTTASFVRGSVSYGFRLEPDPSGGGGNRFPTKTTRCPATFRVLHNDRIGALSFPAGPYWVSIFKDSNITCPQSTQLFAAFLQRPDGSLPSPWVINVATGSFRRGRTSQYGFVAKPAFNDSAAKKPARGPRGRTRPA